MNRRQFGQVLAAAPLAAAAASGWTPEWDRALLLSSVAQSDARFDPKEMMLKSHVGPDYHYHTNVRASVVHPTRDTLDYALELLETKEPERLTRAERVLDRMLAIQETDPASKWYGLWGYYMEEPAPKMSPADYNWADFNGSTLLMIEARHGGRLPDELHERVKQAIHHCAISIQRRNVAMSYTNIAVQGTFVTMAAANLLKDVALQRYATERLHRLVAEIDKTGSFAEYNSPTYANVTIANLTRMRMLLPVDENRPAIDALHHRIWLHLGNHWHVPTEQLAGPISRSYQTDIGSPLWLQKALNNGVVFAPFEKLRGSGEIATLDYRCPADIVPLFTVAAPAHQYREVFTPGVEGTTWLAPAFCLGSVNRGDFWVQRRSLLAYWGGPSRPARYLQMRVMHDDYDFASALLYCVQEKDRVAGIVNFRTPGGDKHPSLDPVPKEGFTAARVTVRCDLAGVPVSAAISADGKPVSIPAKVPLHARIAVNLGGVYLHLQFVDAVFGSEQPVLSIAREKELLVISLDLLGAAKTIRWPDVPEAWTAFTLTMRDTDRALPPAKAARNDGAIHLEWGNLQVTAASAPQAVAKQDAAFDATIDGKPVPLERLGGSV